MTKRKEFFVCKSCKNPFPRPEKKRLHCSVECQFWANVNKTDSCWLWIAGGHKFGYGEFRDNGKLIRAHRFSYELHNGAIPANKSILHHCDNPRCVNPDHLYAGTQAENTRDMIVRDRAGVLSFSDVADIRMRLAKKESCASIGRAYGVTGACIVLIKNGKSHNHTC